MTGVWLAMWLCTALAQVPEERSDGVVLEEHGHYQDIVKGRAETELRDLFLTGLSAALMANTRDGAGTLQPDLKQALNDAGVLDAVEAANGFYLDTGELPPGVRTALEPVVAKASRIAAQLPEGLLSPAYDALLWSPPRPAEVGPFSAGRDLAPVVLMATAPKGRDRWAVLMVLAKTRRSSLQGWSCKRRYDPVLSCEHTLLRKLSKAGPLPPFYSRRLGELDVRLGPEVPEAVVPEPTEEEMAQAVLWRAEAARLESGLAEALGGSWVSLGKFQGQQVLRGSLYEVRVMFTDDRATSLRLQRKQGGTVDAEAVSAFLTVTLGTDTPTWMSKRCGQVSGRTVRLEGDAERPRAVWVNAEPCGLLD